jgi:hypothetical protein
MDDDYVSVSRDGFALISLKPMTSLTWLASGLL